jgi:hypothetical protein
MNKCIKYILTIAVLCFFFNANAQADEDSTTEMPPVVDTVYSVRPTYQNQKENNYFTAVNSVSKVDERKVDDSVVHKLKSDDDYWYANEKPKKKVPKKPSNVGAWTNTLFWILAIGGFIALLVWLLATGNIFLFRKKPKEFKEVEQEEEISEDIFSIEYGKEINKAIASQNFRLAVRLLYLQTLKELSQHELIIYTHEKTNRDYLFQLTSSKYYKDFFSLTRSFDYIWYGKFPLSAEGFSAVQKQFVNFKQQLH